MSRPAPVWGQRPDSSSPGLDAELARSILACPDSVELVVDGHPDASSDPELGMRDEEGTPTFSCRLGSSMARAAHAGRSALATLTSGLAPRDSLTMTGRLATRGMDHCTCCGETRLEVALELDFVLLVRAASERCGGTPVRVPLGAFGSPDLALNRGYLRRAVEHANDCHQDELREVVARTSGTPLEQLLGASLAHLTTRGAELTWIDPDGAHRTGLVFSRPARTCAELAVLLRRELHAGIC